MSYWSDDYKMYICGLTKKRVFFTHIQNCGKISLKKLNENDEIILAVSANEEYYLAFYASEYVGQKSTSIPDKLQKLMKNAKSNKADEKNLNRILLYSSSYLSKTHNIVYIPKRSLIEEFFSKPNNYFTNKENKK